MTLPGRRRRRVSERLIASIFRSLDPESSSGTIKTFTNMAVGPAAADRIVAVVGSWARSGTTTIITITIGGISATVIQCQGTNSGVFIAWAPVPTGTTASVVVSFSASVARATAAAYSHTNYLSAASFDTDTPAGGGASLRSVSIDQSARGVTYVVAFNGSDGDGTFTGATEDFDETGADRTFAGRAFGTGVKKASTSISHSNCRAICAASFR